MTMEMRYWKVNGITLGGIEQGDGELVLLLHGFPAYHKTWEYYLEPLAAAGYRAVAVDLRGYNESSKPSGVRSYQQSAVIEDLLALVEHLGYKSTRLVGHDWGGAIAWSMASWHPDAVSHLAVYNCPHPLAMLGQLRTSLAQMKRSWYIGLFQIPWLPELLIRRFPEKFVRLAFLARRGTFSADDLRDYKLAMLRPGALTATINYYRAAFRESFRPPTYPLITCPTALLWGKRDVALGHEMAVASERYVQGPYQRHDFERHGHWMVNELVEETFPLLLHFLSSEKPPLE